MSNVEQKERLFIGDRVFVAGAPEILEEQLEQGKALDVLGDEGFASVVVTIGVSAGRGQSFRVAGSDYEYPVGGEGHFWRTPTQAEVDGWLSGQAGAPPVGVELSPEKPKRKRGRPARVEGATPAATPAEVFHEAMAAGFNLPPQSEFEIAAPIWARLNRLALLLGSAATRYDRDDAVNVLALILEASQEL